MWDLRLSKLLIALLFLLATFSPVIDIWFQVRAIRAEESTLSQPAVARATGRDLAILCQTCLAHPDWFIDEPSFTPAWTPPSVLRFGPRWVEIRPDSACVEFGGGFHHFGYVVTPVFSTTSGGAAEWAIELYSEDSRTRDLLHFRLAETAQITEKEFANRAFAEFDRRAATDDSCTDQIVAFALKHGEAKRASEMIHRLAAQNPNASSHILVAYAIDLADGDTVANDRLRAWAAAKADFSAWLLAACAFMKVGNIDAAERAVNEACRYPADDPSWLHWNARFRGYAMTRELYDAGRLEACLKLCDSLLAYSGSGQYMATEIATVAQVCRAGKQPGEHPALPPVDPGSIFDPFQGIDFERLRKPPHP